MKIRETIIITSFLVLFGSLSNVYAYEFPPYQGITLKILGDISESYSNNVTFASNDENRIERYRTMLNVGLDFKYEGKRRSLYLLGSASREIFEANSNISKPSENLSLTFNNDFSKYDRISMRGTFDHTQEPGINLAEFDLNACRDYWKDSGLSPAEIESKCNDIKTEFDRFKGRFESYNNNFYFSYNRFFSEYFNVNTNYSNSRNWSTAKGANDSKSNTIGIGLAYKFSEATNLLLSYKYQSTIFEVGEDITRQSFDLGVGQYLTKRLYFNGSIGMDKVSSGDDSFSAEATFKNEVNEKTSASLSYTQGTEISSFINDTFKNWQITANVESLLTEDITGSFSAFYGKGHYSSTDITDILAGAGINLSYNFWRSQRGSVIRGKLGYFYSNLNSTDQTRGYTQNSVNSGLSLVF